MDFWDTLFMVGINEKIFYNKNSVNFDFFYIQQSLCL